MDLGDQFGGFLTHVHRLIGDGMANTRMGDRTSALCPSVFIFSTEQTGMFNRSA